MKPESRRAYSGVVIEQTTITAGADKAGRNPLYPYVPVLVHYTPATDRRRRERILGRAFATRAEAIECAERFIATVKVQQAARAENPLVQRAAKRAAAIDR